MKGTIACIEHDRIDLAYQKQIDLKSGKLVGLEALLRMRDEDGNIIPNDKFIPLIEGESLFSLVVMASLEKLKEAFELKNEFDIARKNKVEVSFAPVNHAKAKGIDVYAGNVPTFDIFSDDLNIADKAQEDVAIMLAAEGFAAHNQDQSALGWYDRTLKAAKALLQDPDVGIYQDIAKNVDNRLAFDWALSVTSNGIGAVPNFGYAGKIYDLWNASSENIEDKRFPIQGWGDSAKSCLLYTSDAADE